MAYQAAVVLNAFRRQRQLRERFAAAGCSGVPVLNVWRHRGYSVPRSGRPGRLADRVLNAIGHQRLLRYAPILITERIYKCSTPGGITGVCG